MSIYWDGQKKQWRFEFKRVIEYRRFRSSKLLPKGWSRAKADSFDQKETARLYALASGVDRNEVSIEYCVALYLKERAQELKSKKSAAEHLAAIYWAYKGKPLSAVDDVSVEVIEHGTAAGWSAATIKQRLALVKAACRYAWKRHKVCETDPTTSMRLPSVKKKAPVWFDRETMLRLCLAADRKDLRAAIRIGFYSGLRLGEMQQCKIRGAVLELEETKNGEPRMVPIHPKIASTVRRYLPLTAPRITIQRAMQRARAKIGEPRISMHKTRHSAASAMLQAGVSLNTVGAVLGHKDPRSTKIYAHLAHAQLQEAVFKIGQKRPHQSTEQGKQPRKRAAKKAA